MSSENFEPKISSPTRRVRSGVVDGLLDPFESEGELASNKEEDLVDLQGVRRDDDAFDDLVGIALEE